MMRSVGPLFSVRSFVLKTLAILALLAVALIPFWLWLFSSFVLDPHGFWQKLFLVGIGIWFLGAIQLVLFIIWVVLAIYILADPPW